MFRFKRLLKENPLTVATTAGAFILTIINQTITFLILLLYFYALRYLNSKNFSPNLHTAILVMIWSSLIIVFSLVFYVNHYIPRGPVIKTDEIVCEYGDRGQCGELMVEDMRRLNIPGWAKIIKGGHGMIFMVFLLIAGCVVINNRKDGGN